MSKLLKTIEMTVMKTTAEDLEHLSKTSHLSIGEVVDRLTARIPAKDPELAYQLISDDIAILMANLSPQDMVKVTYDLTTDFLGVFPPEIMEQIMADAKEARTGAQTEIAAMTQEEKDKMIKEYENSLTHTLREPDIFDKD